MKKHKSQKAFNNPFLLPCPFCGSNALMIEYDFGDNVIWYSPACFSCGVIFEENYCTQKEAIDLWNTRWTG